MAKNHRSFPQLLRNLSSVPRDHNLLSRGTDERFLNNCGKDLWFFTINVISMVNVISGYFESNLRLHSGLEKQRSWTETLK